MLTGITGEYSLVPAENGNAASAPFAITAGSDGNLWFTDPGTSLIGRINPATKAISVFSNGLTAGAQPSYITTGSDGNIWFTETGPSAIGMINPNDPTHTIHEYGTANGLTPNSKPEGITAGPDGNIWFVENLGNKIGMINPNDPTHTIHEFSTGLSTNAGLWSITTGPDHNLWFTESTTHKIGMLNPNDPSHTITEFGTAQGMAADAEPYAITAGSDGNLWFTDYGKKRNGKLGFINPTTHNITELATNLTGNPAFTLPGITASPDGNLWFTVLGDATQSGIDQIGTINPTTKTITTYNPTAGAAPMAIASGPDGNVWFTEFALPVTIGTRHTSGGAIGVVTLSTHLVVTTPAGVSAGTPFGLTARVEYDNGALDTGFNGNLSAVLTTNPGNSLLGGTTQLAATNGVVNLNTLTISNAGTGYVLQVSGPGMAAVTTGPFDVSPAPPPPPPPPAASPPSVTGEQVVLTYLKHNKRGKGIGKPLVSFVFQFSTAMNQSTVTAAGNYRVSWISTRRVRKKTVTVLHPVGVRSVTYNGSNNTVTIATVAKTQNFAKAGGQITIVAAAPGGVSSASNVLLAAPTVFAVGRKASSIHATS